MLKWVPKKLLSYKQVGQKYFSRLKHIFSFHAFSIIDLLYTLQPALRPYYSEKKHYLVTKSPVGLSIALYGSSWSVYSIVQCKISQSYFQRIRECFELSWIKLGGSEHSNHARTLQSDRIHVSGKWLCEGLDRSHGCSTTNCVSGCMRVKHGLCAA